MLKLIVLSLFTCCVAFYSCKHQNQESRLQIKLDKEVTDTVPFCPYIWSAEFSDSISKHQLNEYGFDSIQVGRYDFQQNVYEEEHEFPVMKNSIKAIMAKKNNRSWLGLDTNNNDTIELNEIFDRELLVTYFEVTNIEQYVNKKVETKAFFLQQIQNRIYSESGVRKDINRTIDFRIMPTYRLGFFTLNNEKLKIAIYSNGGNFRDYNQKSTIFVKRSEEAFNKCTTGDPLYKIGDTVHVGQARFILKSIDLSGENLIIDSIGMEKLNSGIEVGYTSLIIEGKDMLSSNSYSTARKNKYLVIDFWGTWCKPCLELTPQIQKIYNQFDRNDLEIVGIAYDKSEEVVKKYLKSKNIPWTNIFDLDSNPVIKENFKIVSFPTFILIDPNGKILIRGTSKETLDEIQGYLETKISQGK